MEELSQAGLKVGEGIAEFPKAALGWGCGPNLNVLGPDSGPE
jgi:hypothetical protein